ncbi:MAG: universal stress protein [Deltaproteobacteria bacterium]|nr:universal stress protein [Deltaproteobacteria bacterium]
MLLPIKKILCPTDFSEASNVSIRVADELALHFGAELILIHVVSPMTAVRPTGTIPIFTKNNYLDEMQRASAESLKDLIENRVCKSVSARPFVAIGRAGEEITRLAEEEHVDLIVLSTHGETGLTRMIFGSVAEKVVRLSSCPVLTLHPTEETGASKNS